MKSSLRSSEKTWPKCFFSYFLQLKMFPLREWGIWRSLCFSGAVMQSHFSGMAQRNFSLKGHEDFCFLDSSFLKCKCNMVLTVLFSSEMAYKMRNCHLKLCFRSTCYWEKNTLWVVNSVKNTESGYKLSEIGKALSSRKESLYLKLKEKVRQ